MHKKKNVCTKKGLGDKMKCLKASKCSGVSYHI